MNKPHFIPVGMEKQTQQIGLEHGLFSQVVKTKHIFIEEKEKSKK